MAFKQGGHKTTLTLSHRFRGNEVRLWLSILAYILGNLWRRLVLPKGDRIVVLDELAAEAGEDGRPVGQARAVLLADAGGRAPDASAVLRCCDGSRCCPFRQTTIIARPVNRIAEDKAGGKSV